MEQCRHFESIPSNFSNFIILRPGPRIYAYTSPLLLLQLHQQQQLLSIIYIIITLIITYNTLNCEYYYSILTSHAAYERSDGPSKRPAAKRPCIYILFLPDAKRPPSLRIAHTGTRYEILDLRDSFGAGTRNSACSSGRCSSGMGPQSTPFWRRARLALAPRRFAGHPRRSLFAGWALPERNVFGGRHR